MVTEQKDPLPGLNWIKLRCDKMSESYVALACLNYNNFFASFIELVAMHYTFDFSTNAWNIALKYDLNLA